jgi:hypothetical protein
MSGSLLVGAVGSPKRAPPRNQLQLAREFTQLVRSATPAASTTVDEIGGIASASRRFARATSTEPAALPGATILAFAIPSVFAGIALQALVAARSVL